MTDDLLKFSPVCIYNNNFNEFIACINNNLPWIFSTAYWINSSDSSDGVNIFGSIGDIGVVDMEPYYVDFSIGVRPVIVIKKSDIAILEN